MLSVLKELLQSKKAVVAIVAVVAQVAGHFGFNIDQTALTTALSPLYVYIIGQAVADHGKSAAEVTASAASAAYERAVAPAPSLLSSAAAAKAGA